MPSAWFHHSGHQVTPGPLRLRRYIGPRYSDEGQEVGEVRLGWRLVLLEGGCFQRLAGGEIGSLAQLSEHRVVEDLGDGGRGDGREALAHRATHGLLSGGFRVGV
jgi:hypothetical protein